MMIFTIGQHIYCVTGDKRRDCNDICDECRYMKAHAQFEAEATKARKESRNATIKA